MKKILRQFYKWGSLVIALYTAFVVLKATFLVPFPWWPFRLTTLAVAALVCGIAFYVFSKFV